MEEAEEERGSARRPMRRSKRSSVFSSSSRFSLSKKLDSSSSRRWVVSSVVPHRAWINRRENTFLFVSSRSVLGAPRGGSGTRETGLESFESTDARGRARVSPKDGLSPYLGAGTTRRMVARERRKKKRGEGRKKTKEKKEGEGKEEMYT